MVKGEFALPLKMEMLKGPKIADIDYQMMEVQNVIPMDEWRFMQEQCFSGNVTFKICFWLLGFRPRPPPEFRSWTPCSATPTFRSTPPWGISCGRPGLVNIL